MRENDYWKSLGEAALIPAVMTVLLLLMVMLDSYHG